MTSDCPLPPPLQPPPLQALLERNETWAKEVSDCDKNFFPALADVQNPTTLWIGCVDSRVPESVITTCRPGDIFVHRNIANLFYLDDDSAQSVLAYAVESLHVQHIVVCGHTACGGVVAAYKTAYPKEKLERVLEDESIKCLKHGTTHLDRWLRSIVELAKEPEFAPGTDNPIPRLIEANVRKQMKNITESVVFKEVNEFTRDLKISIHGWVFDLEKGRLKELHKRDAAPESNAFT